MSVAAIVPAAGLGVRLGSGAPKALRALAGEPLLVHAVRSLLAAGEVDELILVVPADGVDAVRSLLADRERHGQRMVVVAGGASRRESVAAGLQALDTGADLVLVHDAARPLVPPEVVSRVVTALRSGAAAVVPVLPVADTIKRVVADRVVETVDRTTLRAVQTPQGFERAVLERAHAEVRSEVTDDAGMVEELGLAVQVVAGHAEAFKITHPFDLAVAESVLRNR